MRKSALWMALLLVACAASASAAPVDGEQSDKPQSSLPSLSGQMKVFERNVSLGEKLMTRPASPEELDELDRLARRGLAAARAAVEQNPDWADAHYLLGSWLLYGYRVVETKEMPTGPGAPEVTRRVALGMADDCAEGLNELRAAVRLAPDKAQYAIDYGAALLDCGDSREAHSALKEVWIRSRDLTLKERIRTALLLSKASLYLWKFGEARDWAYTALSQVPGNAPAVQRLRELDRAQAQASHSSGGTAPVEAPPAESGE